MCRLTLNVSCRFWMLCAGAIEAELDGLAAEAASLAAGHGFAAEEAADVAAAVSETAEVPLSAVMPAEKPAAAVVALPTPTVVAGAAAGAGAHATTEEAHGLPADASAEAPHDEEAADDAQPAAEPCAEAPAAQPALAQDLPEAALDQGEPATAAVGRGTAAASTAGLAPTQSPATEEEGASSLLRTAGVDAAEAASALGGETAAGTGGSAGLQGPLAASGSPPSAVPAATAGAEYPEGLLGDSEDEDEEPDAGDGAAFGNEGDDVDALFAGMKLPG